MGLPDTFAGFTVIPVVYSSQATHVIYGRAHLGSKKSVQKIFPEGRTLFLVNVPPDATVRELTLLFKNSGTVERVVFDHETAADEVLAPESESDGEDGNDEDEDEDASMNGTDTEEHGEPPTKKRKKTKQGKSDVPTVQPLPSTSLRTLRQTGRTAHVIFLDASSLARALSPSQYRKSRNWPRSSEPRGLAHYTAMHDALRPPLDAVSAHAESAIALFDYEMARKKQQSNYRKGEAIVDEDGFTLVTRGGAYGQTLGGGVAVASKKFQESGESSTHRKKKEGKEKEGFYAFQRHEKKRKEILDLKRKWEEDKAKVAELQNSRLFKPY